MGALGGIERSMTGFGRRLDSIEADAAARRAESAITPESRWAAGLGRPPTLPKETRTP